MEKMHRISKQRQAFSVLLAFFRCRMTSLFQKRGNNFADAQKPRDPEPGVIIEIDSIMKTCLRNAGLFLKEIPKWPPGFDLDPIPGAVGPTTTVPFGDKDGYGVFTALAGFALAQATALTVVAREEEHKLLVLIV